MNPMEKLTLTSSMSCLFAALLVSSVGALAGNDPLSEKSIFLDDLPVVLSASRLAQPLNEAPVAVTIIDREMIRESGAWDMSELFRLVPGMYVAYHADRFYATDSTVAYHGLVTNARSDRMQILLDGRSVYSSMSGGVIWGDIPVLLDDIERIEVIRGPASVSYGANSFSGVINIITREPAESQGQFYSFTTGNGRGEGVLRYGGKSGDLIYRLSVGARKDNGEDVAIKKPTSQLPIWMVNKYDDKTIRQLNLHADYQINYSDHLELQIGYNGGPRQMGELNDLHSFDKVATNHFEMLHWSRALINGGELSVQIFNAIESSDGTYLDSDGPHIGANRINRRNIEVQHTFSSSDTTRLVWGASVRRDTVFSPWFMGISTEYSFETQYYNLTSLFGNLEWRIKPNLVINAGTMLENNNYTGSHITPRLAANWHFFPLHTVRVGVSTGTRSPSVFEKVTEEDRRSPRNYPNVPGIKPEQVKSVELGYLGKFSDVSLDLRLFHDEFTQLIDVSRVSARAGNFNAGSALTRGAEAQLKWQLNERTKLLYNVSHGRTESDDINRVIYSHSMPQTMQSLMLTHYFNHRWNASLMGYQITRTHFNDTDYNVAQNRAYFIPGNHRWDGRLAYQFVTGNKSGELALIVQNIADARYFEYRHDNEVPGRNIRLNLKLDF